MVFRVYQGSQDMFDDFVEDFVFAGCLIVLMTYFTTHLEILVSFRSISSLFKGCLNITRELNACRCVPPTYSSSGRAIFGRRNQFGRSVFCRFMPGGGQNTA
jgi:hypothetical protein